MTHYAPLCDACRTNSPDTFYKACQGCQTRRAKAMAVFHARPGAQLPVPSTNKPQGDS